MSLFTGVSTSSPSLPGVMGLKQFAIVVAATASTRAIGRGGDLPWKLPGDMAYFKRLTSTPSSPGKQNAVIMGRKTWNSIPPKFRPLKERLNVVLSRNPAIREELAIPEDVLVYSSLEEAMASLSIRESLGEVFVIGGGTIYDEAVKSPLCGTVHVTTVHLEGIDDCDTFFPLLSADSFRLTERSSVLSDPSPSGPIQYRFNKYERITDDLVLSVQAPAVASVNHEERQYLDLISEIIEGGTVRGDRTGTGTISKFGVQMRFSLRNEVFPLLTTKRVFWRGVAEELLWFVKGSTNAKELSDKDIHIWDGNGSREFLDKRGLGHREEGDLGPVYGFQWRHFGAEYVDMHADYTGKGVDQLLDCIEKIKTSPEDRRIIMTAWNPADLDKMALPPCHMFCQFYVANGELSCQMYQRSADIGLGVPFNIASYALLTRMVAQVCGLKAGDFVHAIGDAHVYLNHVEALREQVMREPKPFPTLRINPEVTNIDAFTLADFTIEGYSPDASIKMKMAV